MSKRLAGAPNATTRHAAPRQRLLELPYSGGTAAAARFLASLQTLTDGAAPDDDGFYVATRRGPGAARLR